MAVVVVTQSAVLVLSGPLCQQHLWALEGRFSRCLISVVCCMVPHTDRCRCRTPIDATAIRYGNSKFTAWRGVENDTGVYRYSDDDRVDAAVSESVANGTVTVKFTSDELKVCVRHPLQNEAENQLGWRGIRRDQKTKACDPS